MTRNIERVIDVEMEYLRVSFLSLGERCDAVVDWLAYL